jgi:predicted RNase H-like HicB family nuclease
MRLTGGDTPVEGLHQPAPKIAACPAFVFVEDAMKNGANRAMHHHSPDEHTGRFLFIKDDMSFEVTFEFEQDGEYVTGSCPELGIGAFGDDTEEAETALVEAIRLQLEAQEEDGQLRQFLARNGLKLRKRKRPLPWSPVRSQLIPA